MGGRRTWVPGRPVVDRPTSWGRPEGATSTPPTMVPEPSTSAAVAAAWEPFGGGTVTHAMTRRSLTVM